MLWAATRKGLAKFGSNRFHAVDTGKSIQIFGRSTIASDKKGNLYLVTDGGILLGEKGPGGMKFRLMPLPNSTKLRDLRFIGEAVFTDSEGVVWCSQQGQIFRLAGGRPGIIRMPEGVRAQRWDAFLEDRAGNMWIRSSERLLVCRRGSA